MDLGGGYGEFEEGMCVILRLYSSESTEGSKHGICDTSSQAEPLSPKRVWIFWVQAKRFEWWQRSARK